MRSAARSSIRRAARLTCGAAVLALLAPAARAQALVRVSVSTLGEQGSGDSSYPALSGDGRIVAFESFAANLVPGDTNANGDGVRCVSGQLIRFGAHNAGTHGALPGYWTYPNSAQTTPVSAATAQPLGIAAYYQLIYRNLAASFCSDGTTNWTNGLRVDW